MKVLFITGYAENAAASHGFLESGMAMLSMAIPGLPASGCAYQMNAIATKNPTVDAKAP